MTATSEAHAVSGINGQLSPHVVRFLSGQSGRFRTSPLRLSTLGRRDSRRAI
jgi:hypothetical protein